ncbi:rheb-like protein [Chamberlinius hualienensis]
MRTRVALQMDWIHSNEGTSVIRSIFDTRTNERRNFGLLERPMLNVEAEEVVFKVFLSGKSGVGKSDTVSLLTGLELPSTYSETEGIAVMQTYWPAKLLTSKIILFRLEFWDAGDYSIKKFSHILPSCEEEVDAVLYTFSFSDRKSFEEIPKLMSDGPKSTISPCRFAIGTRFDNHLSSDVTMKDISDFEDKYKVPVIKIRNNYNSIQTSKYGQKFRFGEAANALNTLCNQLWNFKEMQEKCSEV